MQAPDLTLDAALRDMHATTPAARDRALRNLAPALLEDLQRPGPVWQATQDHPRGSEVRLALHQALAEPNPATAGVAAVSLGWLGDPVVMESVAEWPLSPEDDEGAQFRRECAVLALSYLGRAAPEASSIRTRVLHVLDRILEAERPELRFQAAAALAEVGDAAVQRRLLRAFEHESHPEVQENLVVALSRIEGLFPETLDTLEHGLALEDAPWNVRLEIALLLAAGGRTSACATLLEALHRRLDRDRALEALAALGSPLALPEVRALAQRWLLPGVTRVRAAYAWARCENPRRGATPPGHALLRRLAWHPRAAVREAVRDAWAALELLDKRAPSTRAE